MVLWTDVLVECLFFLAIIGIQTFCYHKITGLNQIWRGWRLAAVILVFMMTGTGLQLLSLNYSGMKWAGGVFLVIFTLYPLLLMDGKLKERLLTGIVSSMSFYLSSVLSITFLLPQSISMLNNIKVLGRVDTENALWPALVLSGMVVVMYAVFMLLSTHLNTEGKRYIPKRYFTGLILCFSVCLFAFFAATKLLAQTEEVEGLRRNLLLCVMASSVVWVLLYFNFYLIGRYYAKVNEINEIAVQNKNMERFLLRKQASDERIRGLSHDLKHSLIQWRVLAEEKGDEKSLKDILEYEEQLHSTSFINVENESANAIINQKYWEAAGQQIVFSVNGAFHRDLLISNLDLCSLLGNLADNAIEAAVQAEAKHLRRIHLSIRRKGNLLILMMENGYAWEPVWENGGFITGVNLPIRLAIGLMCLAITVLIACRMFQQRDKTAEL